LLKGILLLCCLILVGSLERRREVGGKRGEKESSEMSRKRTNT